MDIFDSKVIIDSFHFEVSDKGPAGDILQISALLNRYEIQPHAINMIFLKRVIVLRNANATILLISHLNQFLIRITSEIERILPFVFLW